MLLRPPLLSVPRPHQHQKEEPQYLGVGRSLSSTLLKKSSGQLLPMGLFAPNAHSLPLSLALRASSRKSVPPFSLQVLTRRTAFVTQIPRGVHRAFREGP